MRLASTSASRSPTTAATAKFHTLLHTRESMEEMGMEARPTMPSANRLAT